MIKELERQPQDFTKLTEELRFELKRASRLAEALGLNKWDFIKILFIIYIVPIEYYNFVFKWNYFSALIEQKESTHNLKISLNLIEEWKKWG